MTTFSDPAIVVDGESTGVLEIFAWARYQGDTRLVDSVIDRSLILKAAKQAGIRWEQSDLQKAADDFRRANGLYRADDMHKWLKGRTLTAGLWQQLLKDDILVSKFKEHRFGPCAEEYFKEHEEDFEHATLGRIVVESENLACELLLQLREENAIFEDLARMHSLERETAEMGGYAGRLTRQDLPAQLSAAIFHSEQGSLHGPLKHGGAYTILKVLSITKPTFAKARLQVIEKMCAVWLSEQRCHSDINVRLYECLDQPVQEQP